MRSRKIQVTVDVDREVWFRFRNLVHANGLSLNRAVEGVLREILRSAGIEVKPEQQSAPVLESEKFAGHPGLDRTSLSGIF